jgi:hypothetical protein
MSGRVVYAPAVRVLAQLRRDPRTVALLMGVPPLLLLALKYALQLAERSTSPSPQGRRCSRWRSVRPPCAGARSSRGPGQRRRL